MAKRKSNSKYYTQLLVYAAFVGLEAVLLSVFSVGQPLVGYTLVLLTTCIAGMVCGKSGGVIIGLVGGLVSFVCGFPGSILAAPMIYKLLVACLPKMFMGFVVGLLYRKIARKINRFLAGVLCVLVGLVINACGVFAVLFLASVLDESLGHMDLVATLKRVFQSFIDLGKSILYILVP